MWQDKGASAALALQGGHNRNSRYCIREGGEKNVERKGVKVVRQEPGEGLEFWQEDVVNLIIWGGARKTVQVERTSELIETEENAEQLWYREG